jgi:hypothetical protein
VGKRNWSFPIVHAIIVDHLRQSDLSVVQTHWRFRSEPAKHRAEKEDGKRKSGTEVMGNVGDRVH